MPRALIVDEGLDGLERLATLLAEHGFTVDVVAAGDELAQVPDGSVDLVISSARRLQRLESRPRRSATDASEAALADRRESESERDVLVRALGERVKELHALHDVAALLRDLEAASDETLRQVAELLPPAMQHPAIAAARISHGQLIVATPNFVAEEPAIRVGFVTGGGSEGAVEVAYVGAVDDGHVPAFLSEEQQLVASVGEMLRAYFEGRHARSVMLRVAQAVSAPIGLTFLEEMTQRMVDALGALGGIIGLLEPDESGRVRTQAYVLGGQRVDDVCYDVAGTPCERIVAGETRVFERDIQSLFPADRMLVEHGIESYAGVPILAPSGRVIGLASVFWASPVLTPGLVLSALQIFAARAAAEVDRQAATAALAASERRLGLLLESVGEGIHGLDREGRITFENPAGLAMLGWTEDEIVGRPSHELLHHHRADGRPYDVDDCPIHRTLRDGLVRQVTGEVFFRRDGSPVPVDYVCAPVRDDRGDLSGAVVSFRDVTERTRSEEALRERDTLIRIAGRLGRIGGWAFSVPEHEVTWSDELFDVLEVAQGTTPGYAVGFDLYEGDDRRRLLDALDDCERHGRPFDLEVRRDTPAGRSIWVRVVGEAVRAPDGHVRRIQGALQDVSDRKMAEQTLRDSEERFRLLASVISDAVWDWDLTRDLVWWNEGYETLFGHVRQTADPTSRSWTDFIHPADRDRVVRGLHDAIGGSGSVWGDEYRFRHRDGHYITVLDRGRVLRDGGGRAYRMLGGMTDLTEQRRAEARLREQATLLDKAQDAILVRDLDHRITYWNKGAERLYGWAADDVLGRAIVDVIYSDPEPFNAAHAITVRDGEWVGQIGQRTRDGRRLMIEGRWTLVRDDDGQPSAVFCINTDITEKKEIEAHFLRAQRMESIGTLAGGIAHDLNNVLTPILMSLDLLKPMSRDQDGRELLHILQSSAQHGADLIRQVLTFARGVEGRRVAVRPDEVVQGVQVIVRDTFPKDILLESSVGRDVWAITGDPTQVHQAVMNLCVNARDAMPDGGRLAIAVRNRAIDTPVTGVAGVAARPGAYVAIDITDTGTGIPSHLQARVFEPFFTTKEVGKGSGLGLSTALAIVRSHGGFIELDSEVGRGTTLVLHFPAQTDARRVGERSPIPPAPPAGRGELILVVDDEPSIREIARRILEQHGYRVAVAGDGAEALAQFVRNPVGFAAVLTDLSMPIMDGSDLIAALRAIEPAVRIIGSSGLANSDSIARQCGVRHFLPKPYTAQRLLRTMAETLEGT